MRETTECFVMSMKLCSTISVECLLWLIVYDYALGKHCFYLSLKPVVSPKKSNGHQCTNDNRVAYSIHSKNLFCFHGFPRSFTLIHMWLQKYLMVCWKLFKIFSYVLLNFFVLCCLIFPQAHALYRCKPGFRTYPPGGRSKNKTFVAICSGDGSWKTVNNTKYSCVPAECPSLPTMYVLCVLLINN